jgi:hypothetical protein
MKLRELFINWLTESRYVAHLEQHVEQLRGDLSTRIAEKDTLVRALRLELAAVKAENERMRLVLMPLGSPAGAMYAAKFGQTVTQETQVTAPQGWDGELKKMLQEEEDGIRSRGRIQEHESRPDDGA